jgi:hypothetical protein
MDLRVSASDVDTFRRFRDDDDFPVEALLRQLRRQEPATLRMDAGSALHKILEEADIAAGVLILDKAETVYNGNRFRFRFDLDAEVALAPVRELKRTRRMQVRGHNVTLVAKVDLLDGLKVKDHKYAKGFDAENYVDSFQWRAYLDVFGADEFVYNIFVGDLEAKTGVWVVDEFHAWSCFRYPGMEKDVFNQLDRFVEFCERFMPEKFTPSTRAA